MKIRLLVLAAFGLVFPSLADWEGYVFLKTNDLASNDNPALINGTKWNDEGNPPTAGKKYYVPVRKGLMSQNGDNIGDWAFAGGSPVRGFKPEAVVKRQNADGSVTYEVPFVRHGLMILIK